jgi:hypothetical protein
MSISWLAPAALVGTALIALPIAVHLLVRQHPRRVLFPSLRFLGQTQLAALRWRTIQDAGLLACRIAIVALAAVALAGPVLQTPARTAGFASRVSRAIVAVGAIDDGLVTRVSENAFAVNTFRRERVADAIADAVRWLDARPASSREVVFAGVLARGTVTGAELALVPSDIGVRFEAVDANAPGAVTVSALVRRDGTLRKVDRDVTLGTDETRVVERNQSDLPGDFVTISATADQVDLANAALRAALDAGVPWADFSTPVAIVWEGGARPSRPTIRVIDMPVPRPSSSAADAVHAALVDASRESLPREPVPIAAEQLRAWTRTPGPVSQTAPLADEGDRRWVWAAVLLLLIVEWRLRRAPSAAAAQQGEEARVA